MPRLLANCLFNCLTYCLFIGLSPFLLLHPKLRQGIKERLGFYGTATTRPPDQQQGPCILAHGASAGDVLALVPTLLELRQQKKSLTLIGSTITNSGYSMLQKYRHLFQQITYLPYDLCGSTKRALKHFQPDLILFEYTELWPQLIQQAARQKIKLVLQNGRFSTNKLQNYRRLFYLTGNLLKHFNYLLVRDKREAMKALSLGASTKQVQITGNTKFNSLNQPLQTDVKETLKQLLQGRLVLVGGSTHEGEEATLLTAFKQLQQQFPALLLVLAPRYIERSQSLLHLCQHKYQLASQLRSLQPLNNHQLEVLILDTFGELTTCYELADLVFIGGSLVKRGGHNILEPAACGKPVLFGPHMQNSTDAVTLLLGRGGIQVTDGSQLTEILADLLKRPTYREELGKLAQMQITKATGAAKRNAQLIAELLKAPQANLT